MYKLVGSVVTADHTQDDYPQNTLKMQSLAFVNAINQARLLEFHLDFLTYEDYNDSLARNGYNLKNVSIKECNDLCNAIHKVDKKVYTPNVTLASMAPTGIAIPATGRAGYITPDNYYSENFITPNIKVEEDPTLYGMASESNFIKNFTSTKLYRTVFESRGYSIVNIDTFSVVENFAGLGINIYARPDFAVVDVAEGVIVGFIEYKTRVNTPALYDNIFNTDVMQVSMYSQLLTEGGRVPRCWIIQNYSRYKYMVTEFNTDETQEVVAGITAQYHSIFCDIASESISNPEGLVFAYLKNTEYHRFWRLTILCHIINRLNDYHEYETTVQDPTKGLFFDSSAKWKIGDGYILKNDVKYLPIPKVSNPIMIGKEFNPIEVNYINLKTGDVSTKLNLLDSDWVQFYPPVLKPFYRKDNFMGDLDHRSDRTFKIPNSRDLRYSNKQKSMSEFLNRWLYERASWLPCYYKCHPVSEPGEVVSEDRYRHRDEERKRDNKGAIIYNGVYVMNESKSNQFKYRRSRMDNYKRWLRGGEKNFYTEQDIKNINEELALKKVVMDEQKEIDALEYSKMATFIRPEHTYNEDNDITSFSCKKQRCSKK